MQFSLIGRKQRKKRIKALSKGFFHSVNSCNARLQLNWFHSHIAPTKSDCNALHVFALNNNKKTFLSLSYHCNTRASLFLISLSRPLSFLLLAHHQQAWSADRCWRALHSLSRLCRLLCINIWDENLYILHTHTEHTLYEMKVCLI